MTEIAKIYQIIFDETYKDKVLLDIELSKIKDTKLVVGMLVDLYSKEEYKADKQSIILAVKNYVNHIPDNIDIREWSKECNDYFISQMKEYQKNSRKTPGVEKLTQFISILDQSKNDAVDGHVDLSKNQTYVDFVKNLSDDELEYFKNILVSIELYEEIVNMQEIYNSK
jgi:DNA-dependent RNA polymerase auxiliary subunit epsilon